MDPKLYRAVIKGDVASMRDLASSDSRFVLLQVTPQGDNIVHVASKHDVKQIADALVHFPQSNFCIKRTQKATLHCTLQQGWGVQKYVKSL
ncbi:ankyrin repeat-containing protein [Gossypium australe]|uniref:Ankyrin repeat-containing protein n=1 Tax=Gossypium australe TaxID=47621 RepID=A0A5B6X058_9ROSI|nr:ankyrin repeat-containing protein [Gossypium australe]